MFQNNLLISFITFIWFIFYIALAFSNMQFWCMIGRSHANQIYLFPQNIVQNINFMLFQNVLSKHQFHSESQKGWFRIWRKKKKKSLKDGDIIFSSMKLGLVRKSDLTLSFQIVLRFKNMLDEKYCGNGL